MRGRLSSVRQPTVAQIILNKSLRLDFMIFFSDIMTLYVGGWSRIFILKPNLSLTIGEVEAPPTLTIYGSATPARVSCLFY